MERLTGGESDITVAEREAVIWAMTDNAKERRRMMREYMPKVSSLDHTPTDAKSKKILVDPQTAQLRELDELEERVKASKERGEKEGKLRAAVAEIVEALTDDFQPDLSLVDFSARTEFAMREGNVRRVNRTVDLGQLGCKYLTSIEVQRHMPTAPTSQLLLAAA